MFNCSILLFIYLPTMLTIAANEKLVYLFKETLFLLLFCNHCEKIYFMSNQFQLESVICKNRISN
jgi:hypothetical protein